MRSLSLAITAVALSAISATAQQQPPPDVNYLLAAISSLESQRNSALNIQANVEAKLTMAQKEIADLKAKLEAKEKPADAKQDTETGSANGRSGPQPGVRKEGRGLGEDR